MRSKNSLLGILTLTLALVTQTQGQSFLTNGLVAYYPFNGSANDASGNGHNGTVTGATLTTDRFGLTNRAFSFSGADTYITAAFDALVFSNDFTASVWFNAYDIANGWPTLLDEESGVSQTDPFNIGISGLTCGCDAPGFLISASAYAPATHAWLLVRRQQTPLGTYHQVVVTRAGTNMTMYLDSQIAVTGQVSNPSMQPGDTLWIGRAAPSTFGGDNPASYAFHGVLDDVRIYNRALSPSEVAQLYAVESTPPIGFETNGLVAFYPFNGNANDESGNGNDGIVSGAQLVADRFGRATSAFSFTSYPQYIDTSSDASPVGTGDFTVSLWASVTLSPGDAQIFFCNSVVNDFQLNLYPNGTITTAPIHLMMGGDYTLDVQTTDVAWEPSKWYNIQVVRSGNSVKIYRDGIGIGENTVTSGVTAPAGSRKLRFGLGVPPQLHQLYGQLDDIRIYDRALSDAEVRELYAIESGPRMDLIKAVKPSFRRLTVNSDYQMQISSDLNSWTNHGSAFTATNTNMIWPEYFDVDNWGSLFFRVQVAP